MGSPKLHVDADIVLYRTLAAVNDQPYYAQIRACEYSLENIVEKAGSHPYNLYLTGKGNFRYQITDTYKSNRKDTVRPRYLTEVKGHFLKYHDALKAEGLEADDLIAMAWRPGDIIVSLDKDFAQITGAVIYNWVKEEFKTIDNGWRFFCEQLLTGDSADAIEGVPNMEKGHHKKIPKYSSKIASELLDGKSTEEMKAVVFEKYKEAYGDEWFDKFDINAQLLWLRRDINDDYSIYW